LRSRTRVRTPHVWRLSSRTLISSMSCMDPPAMIGDGGARRMRRSL
jgi:hypothetical protein